MQRKVSVHYVFALSEGECLLSTEVKKTPLMSSIFACQLRMCFIAFIKENIEIIRNINIEILIMLHSNCQKKLSSTDFLILNAGIVIHKKTNTKVGHYEKRTK